MTQSPKIPAAREILIGALEHNMDHKVRVAIEQALQLMYREKHKDVRSPIRSNPITPERRDAIKAYHDMNPHESTGKIAQVFNVNQGRVSEVLGGKYD